MIKIITMGQRLKEVKFDKGRLVGLMEDGSIIQLESASPGLLTKGSWQCISEGLVSLMDEKIRSLPDDSYVHVGNEKRIEVNISYPIREVLFAIPYTVYQGRKIENSACPKIHNVLKTC